MITIDQLLTPITAAQQLEQFLTTLETIGIKARSWREGGSLRTILRIVAAAYAGFSTSVLGFVRAGFLETSTAGWLTLLAFYVYGVTRRSATFATGKIQLTNAGGGIFTIAAGTLSVTAPATGKAYQNIASFTLNPGTTLAVDVQAVELGTASNATPGMITALQTVLPGVTATNAASVAGVDAETDADLRQRCKDKLGTFSGLGPRSAYSYAVRSALRADGSPVDINRLSVLASPTTGVVTVYVASASGAPLTSDLAYVAASIETYARPDTVTVSLLAAHPVAFARTLTVWARRQDGVSASDIAALVSAALLATISTYPLGGIPKPPSAQGYLYATTIEGAAKAAHPSIFAIDGAGTDIAMSPGDVATLAATVSVTIVEAP